MKMKNGKVTHYATWKENVNRHPSDPHPFKLKKAYHGTGEAEHGHFMKQHKKDSGYPHMHRMKRNPETGNLRELIDLPKRWEIPK